MTSYETIYNRFLQKCTDDDLAKIPEEDLLEMMHGWMESALAKMRKCATDFSLRDDLNGAFETTLEDEEIEIIALLMVCEWLEPQINSVLITHQVFAEKEQNFYSQSKHGDTLMTMRDNCRLEAKKLMRDYTYAHNSYLD